MAKRKSSKRGVPKAGRVLAPTASKGTIGAPATTKQNYATPPFGKK